jgi:hypothetical protein
MFIYSPRLKPLETPKTLPTDPEFVIGLRDNVHLYPMVSTVGNFPENQKTKKMEKIFQFTDIQIQRLKPLVMV